MKNHETTNHGEDKPPKETYKTTGGKILNILRKLRPNKEPEPPKTPVENPVFNEMIFESENPVVERIIAENNLRDGQFVNKILKNLESRYYSEASNFKNELHPSLTFSEAEKLRMYTGIRYNQINRVARHLPWSDELGYFPGREGIKEYKESADDISEIISKSPKCPANMMVFRGTNLDAFKNYGVEGLEDLQKLKGQLYFEPGFTSTSLSRNASFFGRDLEDTYRKPCNIEVIYLIPEGSQEGIALIDDSLSYSKSQEEFLINKGSLSFVKDVEINGDTATITMILIPSATNSKNGREWISEESLINENIGY